MENHIEKVKELLQRCRVSMFGTFEKNKVNFRPMAHVEIDDLGDLWFFTSSSSVKAEHIKANPNVVLTFSNEDENLYLSMEGVAHVSNINKDRMRELFNPFVRAWFPQGLDDPDLSLLKFHPVEIDYWNNPEGKVITYMKMLSSVVTGVRPSGGEHEKLKMTS